MFLSLRTSVYKFENKCFLVLGQVFLVFRTSVSIFKTSVFMFWDKF